MPAWKLTKEHYLNVPGTQWRHEETSQSSGERIEKMFDVPRYLDPSDPRHQNSDGDVVVYQGKKPEGRAWLFVGAPTPDMEPIDDEATAITDKLRATWVAPVESLPNQLDASLFTQLQRENAELKAQLDKAQTAPRRV